ncbi:MAG: D-tyrosyl-tRNA(Tyr) deacylase [Planctomycetota bacterium]|nr:MAG: D-tyrosyl-tRNA(Tyr) deacylase [Planctomycetota bacterium]
MKALLQRVDWARVRVDGAVVGQIGAGLLVFAACCKGDGRRQAETLAARVARYRMFPDAAGKTNRSVLDTGGALLVVSQFTLAADTARGLRPSFDPAMAPAEAEALLSDFSAALRRLGAHVEEGRFGAEMLVELQNHGPATYLLECVPAL